MTVAPLAAVPTTPSAEAAVTASASDQLTPDSGVLFGAHVDRRGAADAPAAVAAFEELIGRKLDLHRWYSTWDSPLPPPAVVDSVARGRTPVWSIQPRTDSGATLSWAAIARGDHDAQIARHADAVKGLGVPLFLVFHHEPDYAQGYGTPADYRAAYRHYTEVFAGRGVTNVAWTWVLTPASFGTRVYTAGADAYYPGDDVVDWIGLDPYNFAGCMPGGPTAWRSMTTVAGPFREWGAARGKPLMFAEWGTVEDGADPGRKAAWYRETLAQLAQWPEVKAIAAFDAAGNCPWWVDSSPTSLQAFRDVAAQGHTHGRPSAWLRTSADHGAAPLAVTFDASRSTGQDNRSGDGVTRWTLAFGDGTSTSGAGQPPASIAHTYASGTHRARLTVTDAAGATNTDTRTVVAAPTPTVTASETARATSSVTLNTWVNPHGYPGTVQFEWGTTTALGSRSPVMDVPAVGHATAYSWTPTGLLPGTTYQVRITARTAAGDTVVTRTAATSGPATFGWASVSGRTASAAKVGGGVHPHHLATSTWVEYGTTAVLGTRSAPVAVAALSYEKGVEVPLAGLRSGTTYSYRFAASNTAGTTYGPVRTFTTLAGTVAGTTTADTTPAAPPTVTASDSDRTSTSVAINTWVHPHGAAGTVQVEWGTTTAYGARSPVIAVPAVDYATGVSYTPTGLTPGVTYHVRITARTAAGVTVVTRTASTSGRPTFGWSTVSGRTTAAAKISGGVHPHHLAATTWVQYGTTSALGRTTATVALEGLSWEKGVDLPVSGLAAGTTYHYRFVARNALGTSYGPIRTFQTLR